MIPTSVTAWDPTYVSAWEECTSQYEALASWLIPHDNGCVLIWPEWVSCIEEYGDSAGEITTSSDLCLTADADACSGILSCWASDSQCPAEAIAYLECGIDSMRGTYGDNTTTTCPPADCGTALPNETTVAPTAAAPATTLDRPPHYLSVTTGATLVYGLMMVLV